MEEIIRHLLSRLDRLEHAWDPWYSTLRGEKGGVLHQQADQQGSSDRIGEYLRSTELLHVVLQQQDLAVLRGRGELEGASSKKRLYSQQGFSACDEYSPKC